MFSTSQPKDAPPCSIERGMLVDIYHDLDHTIFITSARITDVRYDMVYNSWTADVVGFDREIYPRCLTEYMKRRIMSGKDHLNLVL